LHQQLPRVALGQAGCPDLGEAVFDQQAQNLFRVAPVGFLLAHHSGADLGSIPQPQLVPACLHPHPHRRAQRTVKLLGFVAMPQPLFLDFSCLLVKDRYLLKTRMKITAYNQHDLGSFSSLGLFACKPTLLAAPSQRRYGNSPNFS